MFGTRGGLQSFAPCVRGIGRAVFRRLPAGDANAPAVALAIVSCDVPSVGAVRGDALPPLFLR
eukprot:5542318-Lingulodinium_polyedra.AAC.1